MINMTLIFNKIVFLGAKSPKIMIVTLPPGADIKNRIVTIVP
jgi:hypothetical protein